MTAAASIIISASRIGVMEIILIHWFFKHWKRLSGRFSNDSLTLYQGKEATALLMQKERTAEKIKRWEGEEDICVKLELIAPFSKNEQLRKITK